jgi:hypothetical protein
MNFKHKYLKYKSKYLTLKNDIQSGGDINLLDNIQSGGIIPQNADNGAGVVLVEDYRNPRTGEAGTVAIRHRNYVGFFVKLRSPILIANYYNNLQIVRNNNAPREWRETDDVQRVFINDFTISLNNNNVDNNGNLLNVRTSANNQITIFGRTKALIREAINAGFFAGNNLQAIRPNENGDFNGNARGGNQPFLTHTFAYWT